MLYVVATPIGNLEDITFRAVRVLGEANLIACEDTRHVRKLLDHYGIRTPCLSYHDHNEQDRTPELLGRLRSGEVIALVTDAGTPLVSDPGYRLVHAAATEGIPVISVPGACAAIAALSSSGLPTDQFRFGGFLPPKSTQRRKIFESLRDDSSTLIFYEAPHRLVESLADIESVLGARPMAVARELTKFHEETLRGSARQILDVLESRQTPVKGEITILIGKGDGLVEDSRPIAEAVAELVSQGIDKMDAMKRIARERGLSKRDVYRECAGGQN